VTLNIFHPTPLSAQSETMTLRSYISGDGMNAGNLVCKPHAVQRPACWTSSIVTKLLEDMYILTWTEEVEDQKLILSASGIQAVQTVESLGSHSSIPGTMNYYLGSIMLQGQNGSQPFVAITDGQQRSLCLSWMVGWCVRKMAAENLATYLDLEPLTTRGAAKVEVRQQNPLSDVFHTLLEPLCIPSHQISNETLKEACQSIEHNVKRLQNEVKIKRQSQGGTPGGMLMAIETGMQKLVDTLMKAEAKTRAQGLIDNATPALTRGQWSKLIKLRMLNHTDVTVIAHSPEQHVEGPFVSTNNDSKKLDWIDIVKAAAMRVDDPVLAKRVCQIFDSISRETLQISSSATRDKERSLDMTILRAALIHYHQDPVWARNSSRKSSDILMDVSRISRNRKNLALLMDYVETVTPWNRAYRGHPGGEAIVRAHPTIGHFITLHPTKNERFLSQIGAFGEFISSEEIRAINLFMITSNHTARLAAANANRNKEAGGGDYSVFYARALDSLSDNLPKNLKKIGKVYLSSMQQAFKKSGYLTMNTLNSAVNELREGPSQEIAKEALCIYRMIQQGAQQSLPDLKGVHIEHFVAQTYTDEILSELEQAISAPKTKWTQTTKLQQHNRFSRQLGNVFLLDGSTNQSLGNASPNEKQKKLIEANQNKHMIVPSDLMEICHAVHWAEAISERTTRIIDTLQDHFYEQQKIKNKA